jgi:hypothetical protein
MIARYIQCQYAGSQGIPIKEIKHPVRLPPDDEKNVAAAVADIGRGPSPESQQLEQQRNCEWAAWERDGCRGPDPQGIRFMADRIVSADQNNRAELLGPLIDADVLQYFDIKELCRRCDEIDALWAKQDADIARRRLREGRQS